MKFSEVSNDILYQVITVYLDTFKDDTWIYECLLQVNKQLHSFCCSDQVNLN